MGQNHYAVYMLEGDPNTFVYTTSRCENTKALLKDLGFKHQYTAYAYGWSVTDGYLYSVSRYFDMGDMGDKDRIMRLIKINNGTEEKIKAIYKEVCSAQKKNLHRWWQYYSTKK